MGTGRGTNLRPARAKLPGRRWILALALTLATLASTGAGAGSGLYSYETEFLKLIYYSKDHEYVVPHLARCFENSLRFHRRIFEYTPSEKIVVLLTDFSDQGHGGTLTVPWNYITLGLEPFNYVYETMPANERMNWLMHHELVHVVATDKGARGDKRSRSLFRGKIAPTANDPITMLYSYLSSPRWYAPRWYHEGIAVFFETWMSGGLGRVLGGYDEMVFRTMVLDDRHFYDIVGLESEGTTIDFQVGQNSYLYGTRFVTYLALQHGPEKLIDWFDRDEDSKRYFSAQFKKVYGVPLDEEWSRWIEWEREWQRANLELLREYPTTQDHPILASPLGSVSRPFYDAARNRVFAAVNYPAHSAHIAAIYLDDGRMEKIARVSSPALYYVSALAYDASSNKLFYTTDNTRGWRDLNEIDLATGKKKSLLEDCRAGDLVVNPVDKSIWATQHHNGLSSIIRIPPPYEKWENLLTLAYGKDVFDLDISPDGEKLSAALIEINGDQRLVKMETAKLLEGDGSYDVLFEFRNNSPANFVFSPDGRYLYGSSYYSGVSNVFRYDFDRDTLEAITNAETGYFRPLPISDDTLLAFRYSAEGFMPVTIPIEVHDDVNAINYLGQQIVKEHPVVKDWNVGSPAEIDLEAVTTFSGDYKTRDNLKFASIYPVIHGYRDTEAYGVKFNLADPVGLHDIDVMAAYSPSESIGSNEQFHMQVDYSHWPWKVSAAHNASDFYDLFGPTKTSRKGTSLGVRFEKYIVDESSRSLKYHVNLAGYRGLDTLPDYQNVAATFDSYVSANGALDYENLRKTIGAVEHERGLAWRLGLLNNYVDSELLTRVYSDLDYGIPLPLDHSSIWLRSSVGYSFGEESEPFSNFYFGGFGNNWVDHQSVRRFREYYSFPGLELNEVESNNYGKLLVEWTLPPIRFRRLGLPGFYANWSQFALFGSGIVTNFSGSLDRRELVNFGAQVDTKLVLFSNLESTLSIGYALAFEEGRPRSTEFMASLKLLR